MTIGPEPITRTWLRSVRRGTSALLSGREGAQMCTVLRRVGVQTRTFAGGTASSMGRHQVYELVEQVLRVVRTGRGLWMVLHRKGPPVNEFDPFHHSVVGAGVAYHCGAERR